MRSGRPSATDGRPFNVATFVLRSDLAPADAPALITAEGVTTRAALATHVDTLAVWLTARGVGHGDRVVLALPDGVPWVAAFLATVRVGAVAALVADSLDADRAADLVSRADPALVLSHRTDLGIAVVPLEELVAAMGAGTRGQAPGDADHPAGPAIRAQVPGGSPAVPVPTAAGDACYLLATSGSTGPSKWVVHRHRDIPACIATFGRSVMRLGPGDVTWGVSSLATSYGLGNSLYFPLGAGAAAWLGGPRDPAGLAAACRVAGVTAVYGVPTFWARLARHCREGRVDRADLTGVSHAGSAGENLPGTVWTAVQRDAGICIVNGLGSSELTNMYLSDRPHAPRPGTVGWPVPGYDVRIDGARPLPGDEGEVWVQGPTMFAGYMADAAATHAVMVDGWFRTGDRARVEADGSFTFLGRMGDVLKVGALWVDPARVQDVLLGDRDVTDAVVVAAPDADDVLRLVAVVASPALPAQLEPRLFDRLHAALEHHTVPRAMVVVEHLPVTPSGKVRRDLMMQLARDALTTTGVTP